MDDNSQSELTMPDSNPLKLAGTWSFLPASNEVRTLNRPADSHGADMSSAFEDGHFVVIRSDPAGPPVDFVTARGRMAGSDPPALHCFDDHCTRSLAGKHRFVLVAFANSDLATLRLLGFPVTPACGLARLTAAESQLLLTTIGKQATTQPQQKSSTPAERPQLKLILVGVELFRLKNQMPHGLLTVINHFRRIERVMGLKLDEQIGVWLPSAAEFRTVTDAVALADRRLVRSKIIASIKQSTMSVADYLKSTAGPPVNDLFTARHNLSDAITTLPMAMFGTRDVKTRLGDLFRAFDVAFIECMWRDAMGAASSLDRALLTMAAELMQMNFEASELAQRAAAAIETGNAANTMLTLENRLDLNLKITNGLVAIHRQLHQR